MTDKNSGYKPSEDEPFMNMKQVQYFRQRLLDWKQQLLDESNVTISDMQENTLQEPDLIDSASNEAQRALALRARDRARKLISKIDEALMRIDEGTYGFCDETGDPIGVRRLIARPIATLSVEAQERHERRERVQRSIRDM